MFITNFSSLIHYNMQNRRLSCVFDLWSKLLATLIYCPLVDHFYSAIIWNMYQFLIKQTSVWNRHFLQNFTNSLHSFWKMSNTSWSCVHLFLKYHRTLGHSKQNAVSYRWSTPFFIFYTLILEDIVLSNKKNWAYI